MIEVRPGEYVFDAEELPGLAGYSVPLKGMHSWGEHVFQRCPTESFLDDTLYCRECGLTFVIDWRQRQGGDP